MPEDKNTKAIAALNDKLRESFDNSKGHIVATTGFLGLAKSEQYSIIDLIRTFNAFSKANDPYGEHDGGIVHHNGNSVIWKIDYYDKSLEFHSPDPAREDLTSRVLTIMLSSEY